MCINYFENLYLKGNLKGCRPFRKAETKQRRGILVPLTLN